MSVNRRFVLKGMALGGAAALTLGNPAQALASLGAAPAATTAATPTLVLVNAGPAEPIFLQGARAALGPQMRVQRVGSDLVTIVEFERELRRGRPLRVIGLLDDASATLVVDMARSAGARVQWLGQHAAAAGFTRHRLLSTEVAEGCSRQLSRQLHACGAGFSLTEERQNSTASPRQLAAAPRSEAHSGQWAGSLGYLLATLGNRQILPPVAAGSGIPVTGSYVSFSIES